MRTTAFAIAMLALSAASGVAQRLPVSATPSHYALWFAPDLHQQYLDEFILGFRKQFPFQIGMDIAGIHRIYKDTYANLEINGAWEDHVRYAITVEEWDDRRDELMTDWL